MSDLKVGFVGAGNMATALIRGLLVSETLAPEQLRAADVSSQRLEALTSEHGIVTTESNAELTSWASVVVIAVKPQVIAAALAPVARNWSTAKALVSVAAGVPIDTFEQVLPGDARVVRAMPNTASTVLAGATAVAGGSHATDQDLVHAKLLFDAVGRTVVLEEKHLDAVTGLSGGGPGYVMLMIEALADGGVNMGLPRDVALLLAAQTLHGAAKLQLETGEHPGVLKDRVTSPGGTTIAGVKAMENGALRHTLMAAVEAATARSRELGRAAVKK